MLGQQSGPETLTGTSAAGGFSHHKRRSRLSDRLPGKRRRSRWGHAGGGAQESRLLCKPPDRARSAPGQRRSGWKGPPLTRSSPALVQRLPVPHFVPSGHLRTARMRQRHRRPPDVSGPAIPSTVPQTEHRVKPARNCPGPSGERGPPALRAPPSPHALRSGTAPPGAAAPSAFGRSRKGTRSPAPASRPRPAIPAARRQRDAPGPALPAVPYPPPARSLRSRPVSPYRSRSLHAALPTPRIRPGPARPRTSGTRPALPVTHRRAAAALPAAHRALIGPGARARGADRTGWAGPGRSGAAPAGRGREGAGPGERSGTKNDISGAEQDRDRRGGTGTRQSGAEHHGMCGSGMGRGAQRGKASATALDMVLFYYGKGEKATLAQQATRKIYPKNNSVQNRSAEN